MPAGASAREAEARAARMASEALQHDVCPRGAAVCSGDNFGVATYSVGAGRFTEAAMRGILDG
eukprot:8919686-Lingulodinium_polyedra.AAC.1